MIVEMGHINSIGILKTNWRIYLLLVMEPVCGTSYAYTKDLIQLEERNRFRYLKGSKMQ